MKSAAKYSGVVVPMITPFTAEGRIDRPAVRKVVEHLLAAGSSGIFVLGTTGECASLPVHDRLEMVEQTLDCVAGRVMVYAGVSGNCLGESLEAARRYAEMGVGALVAHAPSYFPLTDAQVEAYFIRLADGVPLPLFLYNIPHTTHLSIAIDSIERMRSHPNIAGIKESARDINRQTELLARLGGEDDFAVLLGAPPYYNLGLRGGAIGLVPSGANLEPGPFVAILKAAQAKQWDEVDRLQPVLDSVQQQYQQGRLLGQSLEVLKYLMAGRGLCGPHVLPPLQTMV